jgi:competence protein ComEC
VLNKEIPFLRIIIPLCLGIITGLYLVPGNLFFLLSGLFILTLFSLSLFFNRQLTNPVYGISLALALFVSGLFLYTKEKARLSILDNQETFFSGYLSDYPEEKENSYRLIFRIERKIINNRQEKINGSLLLYCRKSPDLPVFVPGDRLIIRCIPEEINNRSNPYEFNYRFYMENHGIKYYTFIDKDNILIHSIPEHRKLTHRALMIREKIISMFRERGIEGERLALVAAITLGQKDMLDQEQKQHFIKAGVMHIMAVSGLHAMILSMFIFRILFFLKGRLNFIRVIITIIVLWAFAFITGLSPSVMRAAIMYSFLQSGNMMRRPVNGINSVLASALVLILARPSVIFDAGFQLSYAAVIYIIMFYRDLYLKLHFKNRLADLIWQSAAVIVIAQAGTLPLTVMLFNRFPTWFILSNIMIVPLSSLVVILGVLLPVTYPLKFLSMILARILSFITGLTENLTEIASSLPLSTIENIGITVMECVFLFITIFLFIRFLLNRKSLSVLFPVTALLLFFLTSTIKDISVRKSSELVVYNSIGSSVIGIRNGKIINVYSDSIPAIQEVDRHSAVINLKILENKLGEAAYLLKAGVNNILITDSLSTSLLETASPDYIILTGEKPVIENDIKYMLSPDDIIIFSEATGNYRISASIRRMNVVKVHYVKDMGAFSCRL